MARSKRNTDQAITVAWMTARFSGLKELEPLKAYLGDTEAEPGPVEATVEEIRETLARFKIKPDRR